MIISLSQCAFIDERWVQASLCPLAEAQQYCVTWFQDYFQKFGDCAPNRYETFLIITARKVVYEQYSEQMSRQKRVPVQESVFSNLWTTIFPRFINRPWCDIPGINLLSLYIIEKASAAAAASSKILFAYKWHKKIFWQNFFIKIIDNLELIYLFIYIY